MSKHTPGPWVYVNVGDKENCWIVGPMYNDKDETIEQDEAQKVFDGEISDVATEGVCEVIDNSEAFANARLIAAAPDLLEACKAFVAWAQKNAYWDKTGDAYYLAESAIAKAEGYDPDEVEESR